MKRIYQLLILTAGFFMFSCGDAETKVDRDKLVDSENVRDKIIPDTNAAPSGTTRGLDIATEPDDKLINIDEMIIVGSRYVPN